MKISTLERAFPLAAVLAALLGIAAAGPAFANGGDGHGHGHGSEDSGGHHDEGDGHHGDSDGHGDGHGHGHGDGHGHGGGHDFAFGRAAPDAEADRVVEIDALDEMRFEPAGVTVKDGETVRFVVRNTGKMQHSFTLGSPQYQRMHEKEMQGMPMSEMAGHMQGSPNGIVVQPGETGTLTWHFEAGGPVQFACHIPGHYPAGMKGRIRIRQE